MEKTIAFAYPTSPRAALLGAGKTGCFFVTVGKGTEGPIKSFVDAEKFCDKTYPEMPYSYWSLRVDPINEMWRQITVAI